MFVEKDGEYLALGIHYGEFEKGMCRGIFLNHEKREKIFEWVKEIKDWFRFIKRKKMIMKTSKRLNCTC